ncbi:MAG TPA: response regulator transcription factor [Puia sp.]|nr:response regulator transcription factor [Puia sp.]
MITICIVDDQKIMMETLKAIINDSDDISCIGSFSNAEAYIEAYEELRPDITLMDIDLPGMSGIDAIYTIKSNFPKAKFLVLTIFNDDEKVFKALKAGAGGYLLKKHSFDYLIEEINELHHGGAPMSPEIAKKVISYFQNDEGKNDFSKLTEKEKIVLHMIVDGFLYKEIASKLNVTIDAIKKHAHNIYEKLQVRTRSEAIKKYLSH